MKRAIATMGALALLGAGAAAWGYPLPAKYSLKFNNVEMVQNPLIAWNPQGSAVQTFTGLADGLEDNWGVAQITSIIDRTTNTVQWSDGDAGQHLTLMIYGLDVYQVTAIDTDADFIPDDFKLRTQAATWADLNGNGIQDAGEALAAAGVAMYLDDDDLPGYTAYNPNLGPGARTTPTTYTTVTDGVKQVEWVWTGGAVGSDPAALTSVDASALTVPLTGKGSGYLNVVAGSGPVAEILDTNGMLGGADMFVEFNVRTHPDTGLTDYGWDLNSEDPAIGNAVPEPGTMILLGSGLLGLAGIGRRRSKKA